MHSMHKDIHVFLFLTQYAWLETSAKHLPFKIWVLTFPIQVIGTTKLQPRSKKSSFASNSNFSKTELQPTEIVFKCSEQQSITDKN